VTLPTRRLGPAPTGLVEKLLGAVRAEFRVEVYVPAPDDPVLGRPLCSVPGCDRSGWEYGLCGGHNNRWRMQGRPELAGFLADAGTALNGRRGLSHCTVAGCRFGSSGFGLCMRHRDAWTRRAEPDPARWAAAVPAVSSQGRTECVLPFCQVWAENSRQIFSQVPPHPLASARASRGRAVHRALPAARQGARGLPGPGTAAEA